MDAQEILAVIGDLELTRRQQAQTILDLQAIVAARDGRIQELETDTTEET